MKTVKVKTKPKGAPWWPNGLGPQAFNSWGPGSIPGPETETPQAKQLRNTKKMKTKQHTPQDAFKFYKNCTTAASVTVGKG